MKIKAINKVRFIKTYKRVTASTSKEHNFLKCIDDNKEVHDFYIRPNLAEKLKDVEYETPLYLEFVITYKTKDKQYDGVEVKDILFSSNI